MGGYLLNYLRWKTLHESTVFDYDPTTRMFEASAGEGDHPINVQFQAGAYGATEAEQTVLKGQIKTSLTPMVEFIKNPAPDYFGHYINIEVEASADATGLSSAALQKSSALGITAQMPPAEQNRILSNARKDTCVKLIIKILTEELGVTEDELKTKITISGKATVSPNLNDPTARFVKATLSKGAQYLPPPPPDKLEEDIIGCGYNERKSGTEAKKYPYIGYEKKVKTNMKKGQKMTLSFNSYDYPDAFYVKYGDVEKFSGFIGAEKKDKRDFNAELDAYGMDLKQAVDETIKKYGGKIVSDAETDFRVSGTPTEMTTRLKNKLKESELDPKYHDWALMLVGYLNQEGTRQDPIFPTPWTQQSGQAMALPPDEYLVGSKSNGALILKTLLKSGHIGMPNIEDPTYLSDKFTGTDSNPTPEDLKLKEETEDKWEKVKWTIENAGKDLYTKSRRGIDGNTLPPKDITKEKKFISIDKDIALEMIKSGSLAEEIKDRRNLTPNPTNKNALDFNFTFEKDFKDEWLTIIVFSPLSGTEFNVSSKCL